MDSPTTNLQDRAKNLEPYCVSGPRHVRGVAEYVSDSLRFDGMGASKQADYLMTCAEVYAGLKPVEILNNFGGGTCAI